MSKTNGLPGGALAPWTSVWNLATRILKLDVPWSPAQCALIKSVDCVDSMTREEGQAFTAMTGLKPWKPGATPDRFLLWVLPRGAGKTSLSALVAVRDILCNPYRQGPGETCVVAIMSPTVRQAKDAARYAAAYCESPAIAPLVESGTQEEIRFRNNRVIRVTPVDKKGGRIRGATYLSLVMDEAAFLEHSGIMVDKEIFNAVAAGFRNVLDYRALVISTPNGRTGLCWDLYQDHYGKADTGTFVAHTTIDVIRPNMDQALLNQIRSTDPESFKVEFLCEFSAGGAKKFFIEQSVEDCIQKGISRISPDGASASYFAAIDVSGGKRDRHAVTIVRRLDDRRIQQVASLVLDPGVDCYTMREAARQTAELCAEYGVSTVVSDVYGGNYAIEAHAEFGLKVEIRGMNSTLKIQRARALDELMQAGQVMLLDIPLQTDEILKYEKRELPSGAISCGHPNLKNASDDLLDALLLASYEALGNLVELHPPAGLLTRDKADKDKLYAGGKHPGYAKLGPRLAVSSREIAELGEGPGWIAENALKVYPFALWSMGELATHAAIAPVQLMCHLGRDTVLQHCWMRWILATAKEDREILELGDFPSIPAWREIKRRVSECGRGGVVSFGTLLSPRQRYYSEYVVGTANSGQFFEENWPPDLLKLSQTRAWVPTCPPWTKPRREWGVFPENFHAFSWTHSQGWAPRIESIFKEADFERYLAKKKLEQQRADRGVAVALDLSSFFGRTI